MVSLVSKVFSKSLTRSRTSSSPLKAPTESTSFQASVSSTKTTLTMTTAESRPHRRLLPFSMASSPTRPEPRCSSQYSTPLPTRSRSSLTPFSETSIPSTSESTPSSKLKPIDLPRPLFLTSRLIFIHGDFRIAGGVAKSDFLCQYLSNLLNRSIERNKECHTSSSLGAAFLAGLGANIWKNLHDLSAHRKNVQIFEPSYDCEKKYFNYLEEMERWKKVVML